MSEDTRKSDATENGLKTFLRRIADRVLVTILPLLKVQSIGAAFRSLDRIIYSSLRGEVAKDRFFARTRSLFARAAPDLTFSIRTRYGAKMLVNKVDAVNAFLYYHDVWEPALTEYVRSKLVPGDLFVDVGANIGYFTLLASQIVGESGRVIAFEPSPSLFGRLRENIELNNCKNVEIHQLAISNKEEQLSLYLGPKENRGNTSTLPLDGHTFETQVAAIPLDLALSAVDLKRIKIIKIDVEGGEGGVIAGMPSILRNLSPGASILLEISSDFLATVGTSVVDVLTPIIGAGFTLMKIENRYDAGFYGHIGGFPKPRQISCEEATQAIRADLVLEKLDKTRQGEVP